MSIAKGISVNNSDNSLMRTEKFREWSAFAVYCLVFLTVGTTLARALRVDMNPMFPLIFAALAYVLIRACLLWRPAVIILVFLGVLAGFFLNIFQPSAIPDILSEIKSLLENVIDFLRGRGPISEKNAVPLWIIIAAVLCALSFTEIIHFRRLALYFPVYLSILIAYWYQGIDGAFFMIVLLVATSLYFYGMEHGFRTHSESSGNKGWGRTALFYSMAVTLGALLLPDFPVMFDANKIFAGFGDALPADSGLRRFLVSSRDARNPGLFEFRETGFQPDDSVLGGPVVKNTDSVMIVASAVPLYMRGNVKTFYIYNNWISETFVDSIVETNSYFLKAGKPEFFFKIDVVSRSAGARTGFAPYRTHRIDSDLYKNITYNEDDVVTFPETVSGNESYTVYASLAGDAGEPEGSAVPLVNPDRYLQLPRNLPGRIATLAARVCKDIAVPFGKAVAIRDFLRGGYMYSLEAPIAPPGSDFVDYFLFDLKRGYCTYFATALVIMLRTQGIPSRYVEGYLAQDRDMHGSYSVSQDDAHAWVEAYFEGRGWITLDATPGVSPSLANAGQAYLSGDYREYPKVEDALIASSVEEKTYTTPAAEKAKDTPDPGLNESLLFWKSLVRFIPIAMLIGFFVFLFLVLLRIAVLSGREKHYWGQLKTLPEARQIVGIYKNVLGIMALLKEQILPGETAFEFSRRLRVKLDNNELAFNLLTHNFAIARYSLNQLPADALKQAYVQLYHMDRRLRSAFGVFRYTWVRFVKGGIFSFRIDF